MAESTAMARRGLLSLCASVFAAHQNTEWHLVALKSDYTRDRRRAKWTKAM